MIVDLRIEDATTDDTAAVLAINNAAVPAVNDLSATDLADLSAISTLRVARTRTLDVAGAVLTLRRGQSYESLNYRWFAEAFEAFLYVDRIVVHPDARGQGIGRALYEDTLARAVAADLPRVCAEVNVEPPNPLSMAFHTALGFKILAERFNEAAGKVVAMLERPV